MNILYSFTCFVSLFFMYSTNKEWPNPNNDLKLSNYDFEYTEVLKNKSCPRIKPCYTLLKYDVRYRCGSDEMCTYGYKCCRSDCYVHRVCVAPADEDNLLVLLPDKKTHINEKSTSTVDESFSGSSSFKSASLRTTRSLRSSSLDSNKSLSTKSVLETSTANSLQSNYLLSSVINNLSTSALDLTTEKEQKSTYLYSTDLLPKQELVSSTSNVFHDIDSSTQRLTPESLISTLSPTSTSTVSDVVNKSLSTANSAVTSPIEVSTLSGEQSTSNLFQSTTQNNEIYQTENNFATASSVTTTPSLDVNSTTTALKSPISSEASSSSLETSSSSLQTTSSSLETTSSRLETTTSLATSSSLSLEPTSSLENISSSLEAISLSSQANFVSSTTTSPSLEITGFNLQTISSRLENILREEVNATTTSNLTSKVSNQENLTASKLVSDKEYIPLDSGKKGHKPNYVRKEYDKIYHDKEKHKLTISPDVVTTTPIYFYIDDDDESNNVSDGKEYNKTLQEEPQNSNDKLSSQHLIDLNDEGSASGDGNEFGGLNNHHDTSRPINSDDECSGSGDDAEYSGSGDDEILVSHVVNLNIIHRAIDMQKRKFQQPQGDKSSKEGMQREEENKHTNSDKQQSIKESGLVEQLQGQSESNKNVFLEDDDEDNFTSKERSGHSTSIPDSFSGSGDYGESSKEYGSDDLIASYEKANSFKLDSRAGFSDLKEASEATQSNSTRSMDILEEHLNSNAESGSTDSIPTDEARKNATGKPLKGFSEAKALNLTNKEKPVRVNRIKPYYKETSKSPTEYKASAKKLLDMLQENGVVDKEDYIYDE